MSTGILLPLNEITGSSSAAQSVPATLSQSAATLQANGLTVTCTSSSGLSGRYPADQTSVTTLLGVQHFVDRNARFPGRTGQFVVADMSGVAHTFTSALVSNGGQPPSFTQLVYALADFAAICRNIAISGVGTLPSATATIG